ncbi:MULTISPECIES: DoxX family protein [Tenacibaculum]|uniref:DoxX family protein n=1 Tax=Tenacibaculum sp. Pbs-1 TaxID=3238748 RepID=A0AB33KWK0_9FLAO|nr:DoxX family protein [Tenacibaculum mesophilum]KAF9657662.1 DoxX family protein [Tenacibaculum mesophilum]BFF37765.1 DoxX family protein [Tenacibaculum mesophilum]BFF41187.1 DoxX family protein [Tenacibaculum mesophilum]
MFQKIISSDHSKTTIIIRLMVGAVFLSEGIQKFMYPATRGAGRFVKMGFPNPEFFGNFVGVFEIACGILLLMGLLTRGASLAMLINMTVAIVVTKIPIAFGESFGPFNLRELNSYGFWSMTHEMRTDFAMWFGSLFLLIKGAGKWSFDNYFQSKKWANR